MGKSRLGQTCRLPGRVQFVDDSVDGSDSDRLRTYCRTLDDKRLLSVYMNEPQGGLLSTVARSEIDRRRDAKASPKLLGAR